MDDPCKRCQRKGLAIYPVLYAVAPKNLPKSPTEIRKQPEKRGEGVISKHFGEGVLGNVVMDHIYYLRGLEPGYIYLLYPNNVWKGYLIDVSGYPRYYPDLQIEDMPGSIPAESEVEACARQKGKDHTGIEAICIDPVDKGPVWIAYSRYKWTKAVRGEYAKAPSRRMQLIEKLTGESFPHAIEASAFALKWLVADFDPAVVKSLNRVLPENAHLADRSAKAAGIENAMKAMSGTLSKPGVVMALHDPIGITTTLNVFRNTKVWELGNYQTQHARERLIGDAILGFQKAFEKNGHGGEWVKRYYKHYDHVKVGQDRDTYKSTVKEYDFSIKLFSKNVAEWNGSPALAAIWRDFDPKDNESAKSRQIAFAGCVHGMGRDDSERSLWDKWLADNPKDPYAPFWGAFTAMNPKLGEFLVGKKLPDTGKWDKFVGFAKSMNDMGHEFGKMLKERQVEHAISVIGTAVASQLARLAAEKPELYRMIGARVFIVAMVRAGEKIAPVSFSISEQNFTRMFQQAVLGPPMSGPKRLIDAEAKTGTKVYVLRQDGTAGFGLSRTSARIMAVEMWLPQKEAELFRAFKPGAVLVPSESINPVAGLLRYSRSLPGALVWAGLVLQTVNLSNSRADWNQKDAEHGSLSLGIVSGVFGFVGAGSEIAAGAMSKMGARFGAKAIGYAAFGGGVFGALSSVAEGFQQFFKMAERFKAEDDDAMKDYGASGVAFLVAGFAGYAAAAVAAGKSTALAGTYIASLAPAGGMLASIPVIGWMAIGFIAFGIGAYFTWQAIKDTDTALEVWLRKCCYGLAKGAKYTEKEELQEMKYLMYDVAIEVEWKEEWALVKKNFYDGYDVVRFKIRLPSATTESKISCRVTLIGKQRREMIFEDTIWPVVLNGVVQDPHQPELRPAPERASVKARAPAYIWWVPPRIESGSPVRYNGELRVDDDIYSSAEIELSYWPDEVNQPGLVLPSGSRVSVVSD